MSQSGAASVLYGDTTSYNPVAVTEALATPAGQPLIPVAGHDGTNQRQLKTDAAGQLIVSTAPISSTSSALSNVAQSAVSVLLQAASASRLKLIIVNDATKILYVKLGAVASATSFTYKLPPDGMVEIDEWDGIVDGIWASAAGGGFARVTELTP